MSQPHDEIAEIASGAEQVAEHVEEGFDAGEVIIGHVANGGFDHPVVHLPHILGIDFSVTKHVFMLWFVAAIVAVGVILTVRRYLKQDRLVPSGFMTALEYAVQFIQESIVLPNVGAKWVAVWTPLIVTLFVYILGLNTIGLIPVFDVLGLFDYVVLQTAEHSIIKNIVHGGTTATANYNVTAALATITFMSVIIAGSRAHGFVKHWINLVPSGLAWPLYILLIPIEVMGMLVKPFALTMRLAANMTGGHIAILAILSFVFLFSEMASNPMAGIGVGILVSVPMATGILALEIIVVLVQAYVFALLSAVFIGMAINVHH